MPSSTNPHERPIEKYVAGLISFDELMKHYLRAITVEIRRRYPIWLAREDTERRRRELLKRMRREGSP